MNTTRSCGCKSFRTCLICEKELGLQSHEPAREAVAKYETIYDFNPETATLFLNGTDTSIPFPGVQLLKEFVSEEEESGLIEGLDQLPWDTSQSGRRKQNFGPRANFKERKTKVGAFKGFPDCTRFVQERFKSVSALEDYRTVEQCSLEYRPETGACIEPHVDDCWIWGERIVQLNLLSDCALTCVPFKGDRVAKYNLKEVATYPRTLDEPGAAVLHNPFRDRVNETPYGLKPQEKLLDGVVRIPLPRRSLLVFYGEPRYDWEHCVLRDDVKERRLVIAYRELTPPYLPGGREENVGKDILEQAEKFW